MRTNLPVTGHEVLLQEGKTIVSTTDLQGNITYANPYFIHISGFTEEELIGAPQNILRHPDMPAEAFADMWRSICRGYPWTGMVKNRCKNGDFYWVLANVTPVIENGKPVGYMSVRTRPSREMVEQAAQAYAAFRNGKAQGLKISRGKVTADRPLHRLVARMRLSLPARLVLAGALPAVVLAACAASLFGNGSNLLATIATLAALTSLYLGWTLHGAIAAPLRTATGLARQLAGGDLTATFEAARDDETGELLAALRQMSINLRSIIGDVRSNFAMIERATGEIASGNMDLSGRTESQASSLQETAASMEQLNSTVRQSATNVADADRLAERASEMAGQGGDVVSQVVTTMEGISASSHRVLDIIGIIDGIAFQTNILALNAAVEAARAGEQGRGFAVVASEVRALAQRSASAAKEIKTLIDQSIDKVDAGTRLTSSAGTIMADVIASVAQVKQVMNEISNTASEQSLGIGQVNQAVASIDDITQQNAALVEQAAAAAGELVQQTRCVAQAIAVFKVEARRAGQQPRERARLAA
ncbi:methyl-accepting chemotaxis protein [Pseudoduganella umbonata]|uniref:Aerotaxis receptor n=1 Tax=Pseudoduganella umbonata TaxID=864828 RepID=A0A4P8HWQ2_9BURK|nr:PAS domain-containing methyl-accepting chemotaxis protein [Pseudoduganella umbonata]MBB3224576.1 aerotaxis receptor [Pseudoduganella umbonata]QCP13338.1 PAS domain S-box protein [Pseudoduganella umbonata]